MPPKEGEKKKKYGVYGKEGWNMGMRSWNMPVTERGYLFERIKGDLEATSCLVSADLGAPVDLLEHKLDGFSSLPSAVNHLPLLVVNHGGRGRAGRSQLHLENVDVREYTLYVDKNIRCIHLLRSTILFISNHNAQASILGLNIS